MSKVTLTEAAKLAGISRTTLYKDIKKGKVSKGEDKDGNPCIDTAELLRVYGELTEGQKEKTVNDNTVKVDNDNVHEISTLQLKLEHMEELKLRAEQERDEAKEREAERKDEIDRLTGLLEKQTLMLTEFKATDEKKASEIPKKKGLWSRLVQS